VIQGSSELTRRMPTLSLRLAGSFLSRFDTRALAGLLFQPPPRLTRFEPLAPFATMDLTR